MMNKQNLIHINVIRTKTDFKNIERENVNEPILKSNLKEFIRNELEEAAGKLKWNFVNCIEPVEDQMSFDIYTLIYESLVTQERALVHVECERNLN